MVDGVRLVRLPSATLRVRTQGAGSPLVVLAVDPPNVVEHYDALLAAMPKNWRVVVFELPGFGHSIAHHGTGATVDDVVRVVRELLGVLAPEAATTLLAFPCVAAYPAIRLAARHPALVHGLALMQAPSWEQERAWVERIDAKRVLRRRGVGQLVMRLRKRAVARRWYRAAAVDPARFEATALAAFDAGARFGLADALQAMERERPDLRGALQPAVLVWGTKDRSHRRSDPGSLLEVLPQARVVTFEASAHFPELEEPERFVEELRSLLEAANGARRIR